jgi:predicted glycosyltransferase
MELNINQSVGPRIAIYSQDGFGLGHMRRTSSIAWQMYQMRSDASILTISDSQLGQFFRIPPNHDYLKLPSIVKSGPGNWKASHLGVSFDNVLEMRRQLIRSALLGFAPDIFLVDHMPHGAMGELTPSLEAIKDAGLPTRVVLGLRDILDASEVVQNRWEAEGAYDAIERYYSRVLVYGMRDVYDVSEKYAFSDGLCEKVRYCGYVVNQDKPSGVSKIRARYLAGTPAGTRLVVVMAGGGADAHPMMSTILDAIPIVQKEQNIVVAMIQGPFMPEDLSADLNKRAKHTPVRVMDSVKDTLSYVMAADLVISMAGYNSSVEILRSKKPAILVPRPGPSAEQRTRAKLFSSRRWVGMVDPDHLTPETMAREMVLRMKYPQTLQHFHQSNLLGGAIAANQILALLVPEKETAMASIW